MGFLLEKDKEIGRSAAESFGNHASNDVLAANVAKSIVYGNGLVTPEFLSQVTSEGVNPLDAALFESRVNGHVTDILYNNPQIEVESGYIDAKLSEYMSGVKISPDAPAGAFFSPDDCPDDRGKWFVYENGTAVLSHYRNAAEDPKIPYGEKWVGCLNGQEFQDMMQLKSMLVSEITVSSDVLDRGYFYKLSQNLSEPVMDVLRKIVSAESKQYYKNVRSMVGGDAERDNKFVDKQVKSWFSPWTRLAGQMEESIDFFNKSSTTAFGKVFDVNILSGILDIFSEEPDYQPYLQKEFKVFAAKCCEELGFNYMQLPVKFHDAACERTFLRNHPGLYPELDPKGTFYTVFPEDLDDGIVPPGCSIGIDNKGNKFLETFSQNSYVPKDGLFLVKKYNEANFYNVCTKEQFDTLYKVGEDGIAKSVVLKKQEIKPGLRKKNGT